MRSTTGLGRSVSGSADFVAAPLLAWQAPGTMSGVIYTHGAGDNIVSPFDATNRPGQHGLMNALFEQLPVTGYGLVDDNWGNDAAIANTETLRTWAQTAPMPLKPGKVGFIGISMGVMWAMNYALAHPGNVACIAGIIPALNPEDIWANNWNSLAASVNAAYPPTYSDGTVGPTHNPTDYASSFPKTIPVHLWYSTADLVALPVWVTDFQSAVGSSCTITQLSPALNHSDASVGTAPVADVVAFLVANI